MDPNASIVTIGEAIRARQVSPVSLVEACLERIARRNPKLNAFITVLADEARDQARAAEAEVASGHWKGPLHGVPVGIKDFYDTAGIRTTAAFEHFRQRVPAKDAVSVAKLKAAGAIIVGKTNMHRLGAGTTGLESAFGAVRNPRNDGYIPGGSSSGSAAAVASGMCFATLDTDAVGSCRLPAACCGVVGFKGTFGLISGEGILEGEKADPTILLYSHPGISARSAGDAAAVMSVLAQRETPPWEVTPLRIGVADRFKADRDVRGAFEAAVAALRALGHQLAAVEAPFPMPPFGDLHAIEEDRKCVAERFFRSIDVVMLPTTTTKVPSVEEATGDERALSAENTIFANYYGLPAVSVPCGFDGAGLPLGLQIVGKPWDERRVLGVAQQVQPARQAGP